MNTQDTIKQVSAQKQTITLFLFFFIKVHINKTRNSWMFKSKQTNSCLRIYNNYSWQIIFKNIIIKGMEYPMNRDTAMQVEDTIR